MSRFVTIIGIFYTSISASLIYDIWILPNMTQRETEIFIERMRMQSIFSL